MRVIVLPGVRQNWAKQRLTTMSTGGVQGVLVNRAPAATQIHQGTIFERVSNWTQNYPPGSNWPQNAAHKVPAGVGAPLGHILPTGPGGGISCRRAGIPAPGPGSGNSRRGRDFTPQAGISARRQKILPEAGIPAPGPCRWGLRSRFFDSVGLIGPFGIH